MSYHLEYLAQGFRTGSEQVFKGGQRLGRRVSDYHPVEEAPNVRFQWTKGSKTARGGNQWKPHVASKALPKEPESNLPRNPHLRSLFFRLGIGTLPSQIGHGDMMSRGPCLLPMANLQSFSGQFNSINKRHLKLVCPQNIHTHTHFKPHLYMRTKEKTTRGLMHKWHASNSATSGPGANKQQQPGPPAASANPIATSALRRCKWQRCSCPEHSTRW